MKYPIIYDPYVSAEDYTGALAEVVLMCECGFKVTDSQSEIERARLIIKEHQRTRHASQKDKINGT